MKIRGSQTIYQDVEVHDDVIIKAFFDILKKKSNIPSNAFIDGDWLMEDERSPVIRAATERDLEVFELIKTIRKFV